MSKQGYIISTKGPRFSKKEFCTHIISNELYKKFKKNYPEFNISLLEFKNIWVNILAPEIRNQAINNPLGVSLPFYCGDIKFQWLPYTPKKVDIPYRSRTGEEIPLINIKNGNKIPKIIWERRNAVRYNTMLQFYGFDSHRKLEDLAKHKEDNSPGDLRVARITLGGKKYGLK